MNNLLDSLTNWYFSRKALPYWCMVVLDSIAIVLSGILATYISVGGSALAAHFWNTVLLWVCALPCFWIGMRVHRTYSGIIRYSSFTDLMRVMVALLIGTVLAAIAFLFLPKGMQSWMPEITR